MSVFPYTGDFRGCAWNSQALFAAKPGRQLPKMRKAVRLALAHDFTLCTEAHCMQGRADALRLPKGLTALWSNGSASTAGIGIILNHKFLKNFLTVDPVRDWEHIIPGQIAVLHLRGPNGSLDLACVYLPTGGDYTAQDRRNAIIKLGNRIANKDLTLTVMTGDFNFVENVRDRWCLETGAWTGGKDAIETAAFEEYIRKPHGMHEWEQGHFTCEAGGARSRIDRLYCNQHISFQMDRKCSCSVLEWDKKTSVHRPISFSRTSAEEKPSGQRPIATSEVQRENWSAEVQQHFSYLCLQDSLSHNAIRRLILLKDAIRYVSSNPGEGDPSPIDDNTSPDDKLGFTMSCLRALERRHVKGVDKCCKAYPKLREWIPDNANFLVDAREIRKIRDHAIELAREQIQHEIHDLGNGEETAETVGRAKESILLKLRRISPGESTSLDAVQDETGKIHTTPEEIAQTLRQHWQGVFKHKDVNNLALQIWMEELFCKDEHGCYITGLPESHEQVWVISRKAVASAVRQARNSMPGPDGIPAIAYKVLKGTAVDVIYDVVRELGKEGHKDLLVEAFSDRSLDGRHDFNLSLLCCLPKKPHGCLPEGGEYYRGEDTRPLSLVNVDNRIIANAARLTWEPILDKYISKQQQGFIKGRKIINNILDVDYNAMTCSLKCAKGALILFDFRAAFPSISHSFLKDSLRLLGLPGHALSLIEALYNENNCNIAYKGNYYEGFGMHCGVRQGCPLSPLLFAAAVDILLRMLQQRLPNEVFRAYADDIGAVIGDWGHDSKVLEDTFAEFALMSGLELNIKKTLVVPLWEEGIEEIKSELKNSERSWKDVCITSHAVYLGFTEGPGKGDKSWDKPLNKFSRRCREWGTVGEGLQFGAIAFNTFAASVLGYIAQLEDPPLASTKIEAQGLRLIVPGPGEWWCTPSDLHYLKECFGQAKSFHRLGTSSAAAKLRTLHAHDSDIRGTGDGHRLTIAQYHYKLNSLRTSTRYIDRALCWSEWYDRSHMTTLIMNKWSLEGEGVALNQLLTDIAGSPRPWSREVRDKQKKQLQKATMIAIKRARAPDAAARIRHKLSRWFDPDAKGPRDVSATGKLAGPPAHLARRASRRLQLLQQLVPPRVCAATFRLMFNGWCTLRRFQRRGSALNRCVLGCGIDSEDSVEHYCRCPAVQQVLRTKLRKDVPDIQALSFWTLADALSDEHDDLLCSSIICYATYITTNMYRHKGRVSREVAIDALKFNILQAVRGHQGATSFLNSRWVSGRAVMI